MSTWIAIAAAGATSYVFRAAPLLLLGRVHVGDRADRAIPHAAAAASTALLVDALRHGAESAWPLASTFAASVGLGVALRGGSMLRIVAAGCLAYGAIMAVDIWW